jgi:hypothetical protein
MKQLSITQIWLLSIAVILALGVMGAIEKKDQQAAADHAQFVKQLAKQEEAYERKAEFNRLALEGERMTGYAGDIP